MYNAAINRLIIALGAAVALTACGSNNGEKEAAALVEQAQAALDGGNPQLALELTDSVRTAYPRAFEARKEALHLSTLATERVALRRLESADSTLAVLSLRGDSLKQLVKWVDNPVEGYYIAAGAKTDAPYTVTGIHARVSPEGDFYMISTLKGKKVESTSVSVSDGTSSARTATVRHDGERNDRSSGAETITYLAAECDTLARFITEHRGTPLTLTFNGTAGSYTTPLPADMAAQTATLYEYALTLRAGKLALLEKERLSRAIDLARSQAARTFNEE